MIATIHQSRSDLFSHFGNVLLLAKGGQIAYSGRGSDILGHFASLGHTCPSTMNPADFVLDMVSVNLREEKDEAVSREKVEKLIRQFSATQQSGKFGIPNETEAEGLGLVGIEERDLTPMYIAVPILIKRGWLRFKRQPHLAVARIVQVVALGVSIALYFAPLGTDYFSFQNRLGVIQQILFCAFLFSSRWWYGSLLEDKCTLWGCCRMLANTHWNGIPFTGYGGAIPVIPFCTESSVGTRGQGILCQLVLLHILDSRNTFRDRLRPLVLSPPFRCRPGGVRINVLPYCSGLVLHG